MDRLDNFNSPFRERHFNRVFAGYMLEEGTTLYNVMYLYWQLMDNIAGRWNDDFIANIDVKKLTNDYLFWISSNPARAANYITANYDHSQDINYEHYNLIVMLASYAGVSREHEKGALSLAHMLRLAAFHFGQRSFDGSREKLTSIYATLELEGMEFVFQTKTGNESVVVTNSASCEYSLYMADAATNTVLFNEVDRLLWYGGYYNLEILGIVYEYNILSTDALVYDNTNLKYDDNKKYDGGSAA